MAPSAAGTPLQVRSFLKQNLYFFVDAEARVQGKAVIDEAKEIMASRRGLKMSEMEVQEVMDTAHTCRELPETTFIVEVFRELLGKSRKVTKDKEAKYMNEDELKDAQNWIVQAWRKYHLQALWQADFQPTKVPQPVTDIAYWNELLKSLSRVATPRPDICWGIFSLVFTAFQRQVLYDNKVDLAGTTSSTSSSSLKPSA